MLRKVILAALAVVGLVGFTTAPALADSGPGKGGSGGGGRGVRPVKFEGTLIGVNVATRQVVIRRFNGAVVRLTLNPATKIERNDRHVGLGAFRLGDRAEAVIVNGVVTKFEAVGR